jgi:hypothetical protein
MAWRKRKMILYHGSYTQIKKPEILTLEKGRDFGTGFYTTTIKNQAERWAVRTAKLQSIKVNKPSSAVVNIYNFDEQKANKLKTKAFLTADLEWLNFITKCRSDLNFKHDFDIISGKIADDKVGETIEFVLAGIMRKEDAIERLKFEKINDQICFCTKLALETIFFKESYIINL